MKTKLFKKRVGCEWVGERAGCFKQHNREPKLLTTANANVEFAILVSKVCQQPFLWATA